MRLAVRGYLHLFATNWARASITKQAYCFSRDETFDVGNYPRSIKIHIGI